MANCQNNMRYNRQGNMYMQRPSWNMQQRNASRMEPERKAVEARRNVDPNTCGCKEERYEERREDKSNCGCREGQRGGVREERRDCGCREGQHGSAREERRDCGCREGQRGSAREERKGCGCQEEGRQEKSDCGCRKEDRLSGMALAMAYVPWQRWARTYDVCEALQRGTIFEELDKPFLGRGGCNR